MSWREQQVSDLLKINKLLLLIIVHIRTQVHILINWFILRPILCPGFEWNTLNVPCWACCSNVERWEELLPHQNANRCTLFDLLAPKTVFYIKRTSDRLPIWNHFQLTESGAARLEACQSAHPFFMEGGKIFLPHNPHTLLHTDK